MLCKHGVRGSNPLSCTFGLGMSAPTVKQLLEHVDVTTLFSRLSELLSSFFISLGFDDCDSYVEYLSQIIIKL